MITFYRRFSSTRRTASVALLCMAAGMAGLVFVPISSLQATDTTQPAVDAAVAVSGDSPQAAAFRQAVGGAITPLIIELKSEPGVLRKVAAENAGQPLSLQELAAYGRGLAAEQDTFLAGLKDKGVRALMRTNDAPQIDGSVRHIEYRFTYLLNGFVAYVATEDIEKLRTLPEVAHLSEPTEAQFHLNQAVDYSLGTQPTAAERRLAVYGPTQEFRPTDTGAHPETPRPKIDGFEGQGQKIAVIDTGVDWRHPMFGGTGLLTPLPRVSGTAPSPDDNKKVIYYYAVSDAGDPTDDYGHGTLVASNAAGFRVDGSTPPRFGYGTGVNPPQGVGPTPNGVELFGTAPQAEIMAYKVCNIAGRCLGDIELSIEDAASPFTLVASGETGPVPVAKPVADVINLSLGDTAGDPAGSTSRAANNAALAGVIIVASAGNAGVPGPTGDGTIGAPSAATLAISVAASLDPGSIAGGDVLAADQVPTDTRTAGTPGPPEERGAASVANAPQPGERQGIKLFPVAGGGPVPDGSISAHYVYVNQATTPVPPSSVTNRVVIVRGTGAFANIANSVAPLDPAAILIVTTVESATAVVVVNGIPTFTISPEIAEYLLDIMVEGDDDTGEPPSTAISKFPLRIGESVTLSAFQGSIAGFSSRGPNDHANANFRTVKPDVAAPGVAILGAATVDGAPDEAVGLASPTGYTQANGTSFSGPITAGAMALIRQRVREELGFDTTDLADPDYRIKRFKTATVARALLQNSATNLRSGLGVPQGEGAASVASVNEMGSGHINVADALAGKAIMVAPTLLLTTPAEFSPPSASPSPTPMTVEIPTASFGPVPVVGLQGTLERRKEVIIRDVTNGQGGGTYNLTFQNNRGIDSPGFQISFSDINGTPLTSVSVPPGGERSFYVRVVADGQQITAAPTEFQWHVTATHSSGRTLRMPFYYRAVAAEPGAIPPQAAQLQNISTRLNVMTGDNVGIAGFIITGTEPKRVIVRAIGPSLRSDGQPVSGRMQDPALELYDTNGILITSNDNWKDSQQAEIEGSGLAPENDNEAAIVRTLPPGNYTAVMFGKGNTTGVGLVEAYDRDQTGAGRFANISTRGFVQTGDNVMIGGFIAGRQTGPMNVVVRALGPSLADDGVPQPLQDPTVQLVNANGDVINENDDFAASPQAAEVQSRGLAPEDPRESALFQTVNPGNYTAVVRGKAETTGVGLVEVYNVE